jgi:hypothetical protein
MSAIDDKYRELGGPSGFLGRPLGRERRCSHHTKGLFRYFEGGAIFWRLDTGAHEVHGAIREKWKTLGEYHGFLGFPITDQLIAPDSVGRYNHFQNGSIYWTPETGAWEVHGAIKEKWASWDWERGALGYPVSDEMDTPDGGRYNRFQKGLIVWTPEMGAHGISEDGVNLDPLVDFEKLSEAPQYKDLEPPNTHYGNFREFYETIKRDHNIDLKRNVNTITNERKYVGWQVADFWDGNLRLNGYQLSPGERLIITVAQILLMQWHLRDLKNHDKTRISQITKYCKGCFQKRKKAKKDGKWKWIYHGWCSEFVSYVYRRAGVSVDGGKDYCFWCNGSSVRRKPGWCVRDVKHFEEYFRDRGRYRKIQDVRGNPAEDPRLGDYLKEKSHSQLILGTQPINSNEPDKPHNLSLLIIEGNAGGGGAPEGKNKSVQVRWRADIYSDGIRGIGRMGLRL